LAVHAVRDGKRGTCSQSNLLQKSRAGGPFSAAKQPIKKRAGGPFSAAKQPIKKRAGGLPSGSRRLTITLRTAARLASGRAGFFFFLFLCFVFVGRGQHQHRSQAVAGWLFTPSAIENAELVHSPTCFAFSSI